MILSIRKQFSLNLEKCFETVTTRLLFSKLLLILLFSHKFFYYLNKSGGGGPNLLLDPPVLFWEVHGPPGPPGSGPHAIGHRQAEKRTKSVLITKISERIND